MQVMISETKWPVYSLKLKKHSDVAERTLEFRFDKPVGMTFNAGQFMDLTLIDPPETDAEGNTRGFSINAAPDDRELVFTTRLRDTAFKRVLQTMPLGTQVKAEGPFGNLTLHNDASRPAVLLAGGIGITPFRSIVRRAAHEKLPHRILLFYSNRRPEDAPFLDEFYGLARENPNFTFIPTMTQTGGSRLPWTGQTGYIAHELIAKYLRSSTSGKAARSVHFLGLMAFILFFVVHLSLVIAHGFGAGMERIVLGRRRLGAQYLVFHTLDEKWEHPGHGHYYEVIDLETARAPQVILAYEMNGVPLPVEHGAPLRLRVEHQLGYKMAKWVNRIELVEDFRSIGKGQGGWRDDVLNYYPSDAGI
jgi:ferredoxin-NADP reductase